MLREGGARALRADSVRGMTRDHLTSAQSAASMFFPDFFDTYGWGYGVGVVNGARCDLAPTRRYGWDGGFVTSWFNDPQGDLVAILMTQGTNFLFSPEREAAVRSMYEDLSE